MAVILLIEPHADEGGDAKTYRLGIDQRDVAGDHAFAFQLFEAAQAGGGGQADPLRQFLIGDASVGLQLVENPAVNRVQR
ncbi:hypothetical protein NRB_20980 [Novosphingobium sp. 11B]